MAHFAKLGVNGKVIAVIVVANSDTINASGNEDETVGIQFLERSTGWPLWKKTSYNTKAGKYYNSDNTEGDQTKAYRGNYAGIGYTYDENNDIFIAKQPFASWTLNVSTASWEAPVAMPKTTSTIDGKEVPDLYTWNEATKAWNKSTPSA
jgi:hypothetical protein